MKSVKLVALLLVIVASGGWLYYYYASQPAPGETEPHLIPVACTACNKVYVAMVGDEPAKCQFCKQRTAWLAQKCANPRCGTIFAFVRDTAHMAGQVAMQCPKCGGGEFGEVSPNDIPKP